MISEIIEKWIKGILIDGITGNPSGLFDNVNAKVGEIASEVGSTPQAWNSGIFNMLRSLSETVVLPIAAAILALVMCHELIQMITEKNNMHDFDPADFKGHSLSVSDVVVLHQNGQDTAHYCDSVGFQQVPEFLRENPLRTAELSTEQNENMIDGVLNNAPSLGELEAKAKSGEQISLTDLAAAVKAEEKAPKAKKSRTAKPKKPSIRAQLDAAKKEQSKQTPPREKTKELEV